MYKSILFAFIIYVFCLISFLHAAPSQLVPCDYIEETNHGIKIYLNNIKQNFIENKQFDGYDIKFIMYVLPSFDNESGIILYKSKAGEYYLEKIVSKVNTWYLINKYAEDKKIQLNNIPDNAKIEFSDLYSKRKLTISKQTAKNLNKIITKAVKDRKYDPKEFEGYGGQIDGTMILFQISKNECGSPFYGSVGPAKKLVSLSLILEDFLEKKVDEAVLLGESNKILKAN